MFLFFFTPSCIPMAVLWVDPRLHFAGTGRALGSGRGLAGDGVRLALVAVSALRWLDHSNAVYSCKSSVDECVVLARFLVIIAGVLRVCTDWTGNVTENET